MRRYCEGDASAFPELYRRLAPRLYAYLVGLIGERAAAEDLLQQTFLKLHTHRAAYVLGADPVPWAYTIAQRTFLDEARRRKRARLQPRTSDAPAEEPRAQLGGAPEGASVADGPIDPQLLAALQELPEALREALVLTKVDGRSHKEAAAIAGTTPGAMKVRAHRAHVLLRALLGREP